MKENHINKYLLSVCIQTDKHTEFGLDLLQITSSPNHL